MIEQFLIRPTALTTAATTPLPKIETTFLIVVALAVLALLIYAVFFFGRRLITWGHFRDDIIDNETRTQYNKLLNDLYSDAEQNPLNPEDPPPDAFGPLGQLWADNWTGYSYYDDLSQPLPMAIPQDYRNKEEFELAKFEREEMEKQRKRDFELCRDWEKRERKRFAEKAGVLKEKAAKIAEEKTPKSMDVSFLGQGWTFLLEFSTVIVIIFSLVILGFLGTLDGTQIAPILAAIAGYVLGKTASGTLREKEQTPAPPAAPAAAPATPPSPPPAQVPSLTTPPATAPAAAPAEEQPEKPKKPEKNPPNK